MCNHCLRIRSSSKRSIQQHRQVTSDTEDNRAHESRDTCTHRVEPRGEGSREFLTDELVRGRQGALVLCRQGQVPALQDCFMCVSVQLLL